MNNSYKKGRSHENYIKQKLLASGEYNECLRTAGSKGSFDLICLGKLQGNNYAGEYRKLVLLQIGQGKTKKLKQTLKQKYEGVYNVEVRFIE